MATRNIIEYAKKGAKKIPMSYNLTVDEMQVLYSMALSDKPDGKWDAIVTAFRAGFEAGTRAARRKVKCPNV